MVMVIVKETAAQLDEMAVTYNSFASDGMYDQSANADTFGGARHAPWNAVALEAGLPICRRGSVT